MKHRDVLDIAPTLTSRQLQLALLASLFYCNRDVNTGPATYDSRYMAPAGGVVRQKDITWTKTALGSITDLNFTLTG